MGKKVLPANLAERLEYDEASPTCLRWKVDVRSGRHNHIRMHAGDVAGGVNVGDGYVQVGFGGVQYKGHLVVWFLFNGNIPDGFMIDHEDGDKSNNRIGNLRLVTSQVNRMNTAKGVRNTSGAVGVNYAEVKGHGHWRAFWYDLAGGQKSKWFAVSKHGFLPAFKEAVAYREKMIEQLNAQGASYSERHGK